MAEDFRSIPSGMATEIVAEYLELKTLNEMGYNQDLGELSCWQVEAFNIISSTFAEVQKAKLDRIKDKKPKGRRR